MSLFKSSKSRKTADNEKNCREETANNEVGGEVGGVVNDEANDEANVRGFRTTTLNDLVDKGILNPDGSSEGMREYPDEVLKKRFEESGAIEAVIAEIEKKTRWSKDSKSAIDIEKLNLGRWCSNGPQIKFLLRCVQDIYLNAGIYFTISFRVGFCSEGFIYVGCSHRIPEKDSQKIPVSVGTAVFNRSTLGGSSDFEPEIQSFSSLDKSEQIKIKHWFEGFVARSGDTASYVSEYLMKVLENYAINWFTKSKVIPLVEPASDIQVSWKCRLGSGEDNEGITTLDLYYSIDGDRNTQYRQITFLTEEILREWIKFA